MVIKKRNKQTNKNILIKCLKSALKRLGVKNNVVTFHRTDPILNSYDNFFRRLAESDDGIAKNQWTASGHNIAHFVVPILE